LFAAAANASGVSSFADLSMFMLFSFCLLREQKRRAPQQGYARRLAAVVNKLMLNSA